MSRVTVSFQTGLPTGVVSESGALNFSIGVQFPFRLVLFRVDAVLNGLTFV